VRGVLARLPWRNVGFDSRPPPPMTMKKLIYRCERGHETTAGDKWYGEGMKRVPAPQRLVCWTPWEDDMCGLLARRKFAYHGTSHIEKVLREGVDGKYSSCACNCIWLASEPEHAEAFGDVVEVDMTGIDGGFLDEDWQGTYPNGYLGPERLRAYDSERVRPG